MTELVLLAAALTHWAVPPLSDEMRLPDAEPPDGGCLTDLLTGRVYARPTKLPLRDYPMLWSKERERQ